MVKVTKKVEQTFEGHIVVLGEIYQVIEFLAGKYAKGYFTGILTAQSIFTK